MKNSGLDVHAISSPGRRLKEFADAEGVSVHEVKMVRSISPLRDLMAIVSLCIAIRTIRPDIVHAHTPKAGLLGMIAAWIMRVPIRIYHIRGLPLVTSTGPHYWLLRFAEWVACRLAHRVLSVSRSVRSVALEKGLCKPSKITVLCDGSGNGVDSAKQFNPKAKTDPCGICIRENHGISSDSLVVGFVGRLTRDKGILELREAWNALRLEFPNLHLLVLGSVDAREPISSGIVESFCNDSRVHLVRETSEVQEYYKGFDVCVLPTYREGLPNVLLEAAAMECPVVASAVPGCIDVVDNGETGFLVPARDSDRLRLAIRQYLRSSQMRRRHGKAARRLVQAKFRRETIWQALYDEYCALAAQRGVEFPDGNSHIPRVPRGRHVA